MEGCGSRVAADDIRPQASGGGFFSNRKIEIDLAVAHLHENAALLRIQNALLDTPIIVQDGVAFAMVSVAVDIAGAEDGSSGRGALRGIGRMDANREPQLFANFNSTAERLQTKFTNDGAADTDFYTNNFAGMSNHLLPHFFDADHFVVQRFIDALAGLTDRRKVDETLETRSLAGNITAIHGRVIGIARAAHIDSGGHASSKQLVGIHPKSASVLEEMDVIVDEARK